MTLGERIKKLRNSKKMTLSVMAERIGVTISAVAAYENGTRTPSVDVLIKIAKLFNMTIDHLLGYANKDLIDISGLTPTQREIIQNMILVYKKFNCLVQDTFHARGDDIDSYMHDDMDRFSEQLGQRRNERV